MDSVVVPSIDTAEKTVKEKLAAFIEHARGMIYFSGTNPLVWDDDTWDLRSRVASRTESRSLVLHFITFESAGNIKKSHKSALSGPFVDAAKALVVHAILGGRISAPLRRLMALRSIEKAFRLLDRPADIASLDHVILDKAAKLMLSRHDDQSGYFPALAQLAKAISGRQLSIAHIDWKNPTKPKTDQRRSVQVNEDGSSRAC